MSKYWMIGSGVALGALLIVAIVIALIRDAVILAEGSPERTVQLYLEAVSDNDFAVVREMFSSELKGQCTLDYMVSRSFERQSLKDSRVVHDTTNFVDDRAIVVFEVTQISRNGPFGIGEGWSRDEHYTLIKEKGEWRLSANPWPYQSCAQP